MGAALFLAGAGAAVAVTIVLRPAPAKDDRRAVLASSSEEGAAAPTSASAESGAPRRDEHASMRAAILDAIARAPVKDAQDVDRYLESLIEQARRRGRVTALDIEPGIAVALNHAGDSSKVDAFTARMRQLQRELGGKPTEDPTPARARAELAGMLDQLKAPGDDAHRGQLVQRYLQLSTTLDPEESIRAADALEKLVGRKEEPGSRERSADGFRKALQDIDAKKEPAMRQVLIRQYLDRIAQLPPDEQHARLEELNQIGTAVSSESKPAGSIPGP